MPVTHAPDVTPEEALRALITSGGTAALLGDRDPLELVGVAAAEASRAFLHVDCRGLRTDTFDRAIRGHWRNGSWDEGALTRVMRSGGVFLFVHGEALLDDLRQRTLRMLLTRRVTLTGPHPDDDVTVVAPPATVLIIHVDDHVPVLLQVMVGARRLPAVIRADVDGPPPVARR